MATRQTSQSGMADCVLLVMQRAAIGHAIRLERKKKDLLDFLYRSCRGINGGVEVCVGL